MRLYDEIFKNADGAAFTRCVIVPCGGGYFEGVKSVADFSEERLVLVFPSQTVEIEGKALRIKKYCDGDLHLLGSVTALRVLHPSSQSEEKPLFAHGGKGGKS